MHSQEASNPTYTNRCSSCGAGLLNSTLRFWNIISLGFHFFVRIINILLCRFFWTFLDLLEIAICECGIVRPWRFLSEDRGADCVAVAAIGCMIIKDILTCEFLNWRGSDVDLEEDIELGPVRDESVHNGEEGNQPSRYEVPASAFTKPMSI